MNCTPTGILQNAGNDELANGNIQAEFRKDHRDKTTHCVVEPAEHKVIQAIELEEQKL